jgi:serine phosphatase RsbU (regulator of sigma subunit)
MPGLEAWVYSHAYGDSAAGGGDVHYVSSCATGRVTRLLLADVSGHGAPVCDVAGTLRSLMRRYVNYIDQAEFVRAMNGQFVNLSASGCFATAIVTTFFGPTNGLSLCNAGHPPPLLYRARTRRWEYLDLNARRDEEHSRASADGDEDDVSNIPLGVIDMVNYEQFQVTLEPGDLVLCYTDSLVEARDAAGELLGQDGLLAIVRRLGSIGAGALIPTLLGAIDAVRPGNLGADDVTVLLFRPTGLGVRPPLRDRLLAPIRVLSGVLNSVLAGAGPAPLPEISVANIGGALFNPLNHIRRRKSRHPEE